MPVSDIRAGRTVGRVLLIRMGRPVFQPRIIGNGRRLGRVERLVGVNVTAGKAKDAGERDGAGKDIVHHVP